MIIAGTGHRPNKLGGYGAAVEAALAEVALDWLYTSKPSDVISGGALGWDTALAVAARDMDIPLTMALPFKGFDCKWPQKPRDKLASLVKDAHRVIYVSEEGYAPWKMQTRNIWMVDNSDLVLALWDGSDGGTGNCIKYANKIGKPIVNLWEKYARVD